MSRSKAQSGRWKLVERADRRTLWTMLKVEKWNRQLLRKVGEGDRSAMLVSDERRTEVGERTRDTAREMAFQEPRTEGSHSLQLQRFSSIRTAVGDRGGFGPVE